MSSTLERGALLHKRYRIVEILGQGGMGSVYRAVDENLGVDVAVKENLFASDEYARQFRLEAILLANLRHPHLPRVTDHFVIDNQGQYLIMDYIEGEDLRQRMERLGCVTEQEALLIGVAMCDALEYLHTRKPSVIHRDVKPGNVRIAPDGHIFLVDFGLAKLVKGSQATTTGARAMTPGYSPPEQYGTARTDPRTDVYSLGATLYASLTGVIPEDGLARAMDNVELTPLRKRNPNITRRLATTIEKAMAVRPEDRYQSAEEFKQALVTTNVKTQKLSGDLILEPPPPLDDEVDENAKLARELVTPAGPPPAIVPPTPPPSNGKRRKSRPRPFTVLSILIVAVVAGAGVYFWAPLSRTMLSWLVTSTPTGAVAGVQASATAPAVDPVALERTSTATRKPTSTPTVPSPTPSSTFTSTPTEIVLPTITPNAGGSLLPTPLGGGYGEVAFASDQNGSLQIYIVNTDNSGETRLTDMPDGACQPDWSPDGSHIVFISPCSLREEQYPGARLYVMKADGTEVMALPYSDQGDYDPAWSPDGSKIAFTSLRNGSAQIFTMTLPDYAVTQLTQPATDGRMPDWSMQPAWSPDGSLIAYAGHNKPANTRQIWVMDSDGQNPDLLMARGPGYWDFMPAWSHNGKTVIFNETQGAQSLGWIMLFDYSRRETPTAIHLRSGAYAGHASYSPDDIWVAYESVDITDPTNPSFNIYIMKAAAGNSPIKIGTSSTLDINPAWRPLK